jgi:hypothetical protein
MFSFSLRRNMTPPIAPFKWPFGVSLREWRLFKTFSLPRQDSFYQSVLCQMRLLINRILRNQLFIL